MVRALPYDPLRTFQFRLRLLQNPSGAEEDGAGGGATGYIAGVNRVSGLNATVSAVEIWSGGNSLHRHAHPDRVMWDPITLEQGLALDGTLAEWAEAAIAYAAQATTDVSHGPVKRGVILEVWDPYATFPPLDVTGEPLDRSAPTHPMYRYIIHNAWISRYQAMPSLDAQANEVALMSVEITHEGWRYEAVSPDQSVLGEPGSPLEQPGGPDLFDPNATTAVA